MKLPNLIAEKNLFSRGIQGVAGIDEAGRGAWAGPLVAGAVLITPEIFEKIQGSRKIRQELRLIRDSKILTPLKRDVAFTIITRYFPYSYGVISSRTIDEKGLGFANQRAMDKALAGIDAPVPHVLCDGRGFVFSGAFENIIDGDAKVFCISAASIVAKVTRDRMMERYHKEFGKYSFHRHKGYGTELHQKMLKKYGVCPIHRRSFKPIHEFVGEADV